MSTTQTQQRAHPSPVAAATAAARSSGARREKLARGLLLGAALLYVLVLLIGPLAGIIYYAFKSGLGVIGQTFGQPDVLHAFYLTFVIMLVTVVVNTVFGVLVALVLARDHFPGKRLVSALVDVPLAVSPVIVGLMAVLLFGRGGWFEPFFAAHGIQVIFALPSMILVTIFISIPFVIREVAPVLQGLGLEQEQAAWTLGASKVRAFFWVTLPNIRWGLLYGIALSATRAIGEVGAVLVVSGSIEGHTETATLYILRSFNQFRDQQGYIVALTLAAFSVVLLAGVEQFHRNQAREAG